MGIYRGLVDYGLFWKPPWRRRIFVHTSGGFPALLGSRSDYSLLVLQVPGENPVSEYLATDADVVPLDMKNGDFTLTADARRRRATGVRWATFSKYAWFL